MKRAGSMLLVAALWSCAQEPPPADPGAARIGIVVLHEEGGDPYARTLRFTRTMQREGFLTDSPEMPWSPRRGYDAGVDAMLKEIDASVARLKSRGAQKIFVAGNSLGGAAALRYARLRRVDGLIVLAPGDAPGGPQKAKSAEYSEAKGAMSLSQNAAAIRRGTPVLWVAAGSEAPEAKKAGRAAFDALPDSPPPKFIEVSAGRLDTPDAAGAVCAAWIRDSARAEKK